MSRQRPLKGEAEDTMTLADARGVQVVANLPAHQLGIGGQRVQRERDREGGLGGDAAAGALQDETFQAAAIQDQPEHTREALAFETVAFGGCGH